ncbi:MAG: pcp 2 [Phycisphaerales bacterium]|nr:pcp 2 [Phycisphaerales bacterium]
MHRTQRRSNDQSRKRRENSKPIESLESRRLLSATISLNQPVHPAINIAPAAVSGFTGYSPSQISQAYGFNQVSFNGGSIQGTGAGQTIAIVDAYNDPNILNDLTQFDAHFGIAAPPSFSNVSQTGGSVAGITTDAGWAGEIALDVEWAHAIAPQANILLVSASSQSLGDLLTAVNYARNAPGVSTVSMSWGGSEFYGQTAYDSLFTTPAGHTGVTFVAASGDSGSWWGPQWPASSPNVLSVGGTSLTLANSTGTYGSETGWGGSGGGVSRVESEPGYQSNAQGTGARTTPDVSYNANPNTGFAVYDSVPYQGQSGWSVIGGTSAGAPQWAALVAIADQGRALNNLGPLDGSSQTLPMLYSMYNSNGTYTTSYHDVNSGASSWFMSAGVGYDGVTGLGTPQAGAIAKVLAGTGSATATGASSIIRNKPESRAVARAASIASATNVPSVFSEITVRAGTTLQIARAVEVVPDIASVRVASAGTALSVGATNTAAALDASLVTWVGSGPPAFRVASPAGALSAAEAIARAIAPGGSVEGTPAAPAAAIAGAVARAAGPILAATEPANVFYHFANFDPIATFSGAIKAFADESASIPLIGAAETDGHFSRAWTITAVVLAIDAVLVGRWYADRSAARRARSKAAAAGMCGEIDSAHEWRE